jgi:tryptophan-rich sensory protein
MDWYDTALKPKWAPRRDLFGKVWRILYPVIIATYLYVFVLTILGTISWYIAFFFFVSAGLIVGFPYIQADFAKLGLSSAIAWALVSVQFLVLLGAYSYSWWLAFLILPVFVWLAIAAVLQTTIWILNTGR